MERRWLERDELARQAGRLGGGAALAYVADPNAAQHAAFLWGVVVPARLYGGLR